MSPGSAKFVALGLGTTIAATIGFLGRGPWQRLLLEQEVREANATWEAENALSPEAEACRKLVLDHVSDASGSAWAGSYSWSNGFEGDVFDLSPAGFFYVYRCCSGRGDLAYGDVTSVEGSCLRLKVRNRDLRGESGFGFEDEVYSIAWGRERFLVPASRMREFCSKVAASGTDSMSDAEFPHRLAAGESGFRDPLELTGLPEVPVEYRSLLHR